MVKKFCLQLLVSSGLCVIFALPSVTVAAPGSEPAPKPVALKIEGEITADTLDEFVTALESIRAQRQKIILNAVQLDSGGGSARIAKSIGRIIRQNRLNTYVAPDAVCASACVDILISGVQRYPFGQVRVHRSTFMTDRVNLNKLDQTLEFWKDIGEQYIEEMGVSVMLADAINTTESWRIRVLTDTEKRQWQVFGIDRYEEELQFTQIARRRHISRTEFIDIFKEHYDQCLTAVRNLESTIFECAASRHRKPLTYIERIRQWMFPKPDLIDSLVRADSNFEDNVHAIQHAIRRGKVYLRYAEISEINEADFKALKQKSLPDGMIALLEKSNHWWVEQNKLFIMMRNPTSEPIKGIVFELSSQTCKKAAESPSYLYVSLLAEFEARNVLVYSGELPFDYDAAIGSGIRCGLIKAAVQQ